MRSSLRCKKQLWIQLQLLDSGGGVDCASRYFEEGQVGIVALALNSGGGGQASRGCSEQGEEAAKETAKVQQKTVVFVADQCSDKGSSLQRSRT